MPRGGSGFIDRGVTKYQSLRLAACNERRSSGILRQACLVVEMFSSVYVPPRALLASWGALTDLRQEATAADMYFWAFMYCLICFSPLRGIELLLWDAWQTRRSRKKSVFSTLEERVAQWQFPCHRRQLCCESKQGRYSLRLALCMLSECWRCLLSSLKCLSIGRPLEKTELPVSWRNARHFFPWQEWAS